MCFCKKFKKERDVFLNKPNGEKEIDPSKLRVSVGEAYSKHLTVVKELSKSTRHIPKSVRAGLEKSNATLNDQFNKLGVIYEGTDPISDATKTFNN